MSEPTARQSPADIYIAALRAQRDTLEIQNAGLRFQLEAVRAENADLKRQLQDAAEDSRFDMRDHEIHEMPREETD